MKRSLILLLFTAFSAVSCGTAAQYATTESRFQDGIYYKPNPVESSEAEAEESRENYILVDPHIAFPLLGYSIISPWYHSPWYYDRWSWRWGWNHWDPWYYNRWSWKWDWNWRYWDPWYYEMWCWDPFWSPGWGHGRWWGRGWGAWEPVGPIGPYGPGGIHRNVYYGHREATNVGGTVYSPGRGRTGGAGTIRSGIGSGSYVNYGAHRSSGTGTTPNYSYPKGTTGTSGGGLRRSFEGSTSSSTGSSYNRSSGSNYSRGSSYSGGGSSYSGGTRSSGGSYGGGSYSGGSGGHSGGGGSRGGHR